LLQCGAAKVQSDRPAAVNALVEKFGGVAVLKGAGTLIADGGGLPAICTAGNPGMAAAGMGDTLAGVIAAFLAQGLSLSQAATVGVEVHARAGDIAARGGERGMLATDVLNALRSVVNP
jgi:NAD(P)H-hydrate epimerase